MRALTTALFLLFGGYINSQTGNMYSCRTACNIGVQIGDHKSGDLITIGGLFKAAGIKSEAEKFTVLSYRITIDGSGFSCDLFEIDNPGDKFTDKTLSAFRKLRRGNFLSIDYITANDSHGYIIGLKPAFYIIR